MHGQEARLLTITPGSDSSWVAVEANFHIPSDVYEALRRAVRTAAVSQKSWFLGNRVIILQLGSQSEWRSTNFTNRLLAAFGNQQCRVDQLRTKDRPSRLLDLLLGVPDMSRGQLETALVWVVAVRDALYGALHDRGVPD
jgi:hypothetical protein